MGHVPEGGQGLNRSSRCSGMPDNTEMVQKMVWFEYVVHGPQVDGKPYQTALIPLAVANMPYTDPTGENVPLRRRILLELVEQLAERDEGVTEGQKQGAPRIKIEDFDKDGFIFLRTQ